MTDTTSAVAEQLRRYREAIEKSTVADETEASRWAYEVHTQFKALRESEEGRNAISALMNDDDRLVRRWAATHSLTWDRERARGVLLNLDADA
jgi:hypothetical protein